jgi:hypothetical protein
MVIKLNFVIAFAWLSLEKCIYVSLYLPQEPEITVNRTLANESELLISWEIPGSHGGGAHEDVFWDAAPAPTSQKAVIFMLISCLHIVTATNVQTYIQLLHTSVGLCKIC